MVSTFEGAFPASAWYEVFRRYSFSLYPLFHWGYVNKRR